MSDIVLIDTADRVATITMNRPAARNAIDGDLLDALVAAVADAESDAGVDVLVLTGTDPAFCAGLDLKAVGSGDHRLMETAPSRDTEVRDRGPFRSITKPLIGAVNGFAITGGLEIALACDFLIASENAKFADTHTRVGLQPWWGLTVLLPQAIGVRRAREMSATGNFIDAHRAMEWGLVNRVVPHDQLMETAHQLAVDITSCDQDAVRRIFATYEAGEFLTGHDAWLLEAEVAAEWTSVVRTDQIGARREAVAERGRGQS